MPARLVDLIRRGRLAPRERVAAGDTLAQLGDPRFRTDGWSLPAGPLLGFVEIPAGDFLMGSDPDRDPAARPEEQPQHPVQLPRYFIGRYPVTEAQFDALIAESGYRPDNWGYLRGRANHPVAWVTFHDVLNYCDWLGKTLRDWAETPEPLAGLLRNGNYRITLPSEAEWERAARGADGRLYPWGDDAPEPRHANYRDTGIGDTSSVGSFPDGASAYGCLD
ncbi:MAG: formylglycine-generating enzyme family protein, partial [Candidatus Limnocylindria bacterium]